MKGIGALVMAVLLFGGFLTRNSGGASGSAGEQSRRVDAPPATVMAVIRDSLLAEGFEIVSRASDGDRYRQVVTSHEFAADPETERMARLGDLIMTAHVDEDEARIETRFTQLSTVAGYRISVAPISDGKRSVATLTPHLEQGSGREAERLARNLRAVMDRHGREILSRLAAAARS